MSDGVFHHWSEAGPKETTRSYLKIGNMEEHKSYILGKVKAKVKHTDIVAALKADKNIDLPLHKLKRLLKEWGGAKKALTMGRRLMIRRGIEERQKQKKQSHKVILSRRGKGDPKKGWRISQGEIDSIMKDSPTSYRNVKMNLKDDFVAFSTPTPKSGSEATSGDQIGLVDDMDIEEEAPDDGPAESHILSGGTPNGLLAQSNNDIPEDCDGMEIIETDKHRFYEARLGGLPPWAEEWGMVDQEEDIRDPDQLIDTLVKLGIQNKDAIIAECEKDDADTLYGREDSIEDIQEIVSNGLSGLFTMDAEADAEESDASDFDSSGSENHSDWCDCGAETALTIYACENRRHLWGDIDVWKEEAEDFLADVEKVSKQRIVSLEEAVARVSEEWERAEGREPLPYHTFEQILSGEKFCGLIDGVDTELLCGIIEDHFDALSRVLAREGRDLIKERFNGWVVHLPFILQRYGLCHFFTAWALTQTSNVFFNLLGTVAGVSELWCPFGAAALCIYDAIGMATHTYALDRISYDLSRMERGLARAYDRARERVRRQVSRRYGRFHLRTLRLCVDTATDMIDSPSLRPRGEEMLFGVLQILQERYGSYMGVRKIEMIVFFEELGRSLLTLQRYDLAARVLAGPSRSEYGINRILADPSFTCSHQLGVSYAHLGRYKESLRALFSCFNHSRSIFHINDRRSIQQINVITDVMHQRGPILYHSLDSTFDKLLGSFEKAGKANTEAYQILYSARRRGGINTQEYTNMMALRPPIQSMTLNMGVFMFYKGLECWLAHQDLTVPSQDDLMLETSQGDWVEEIETGYTGTLKRMPVE